MIVSTEPINNMVCKHTHQHQNNFNKYILIDQLYFIMIAYFFVYYFVTTTSVIAPSLKK